MGMGLVPWPVGWFSTLRRGSAVTLLFLFAALPALMFWVLVVAMVETPLEAARRQKMRKRQP